MSEIHRFLFDGLPLRGALVRLDDAWCEILQRRAKGEHGAYPLALQNLLGEMTAAAVLMRANIKFDGRLVLQILGDGPVKLATVEVQADLGLRASATLKGELPAAASLDQMINQRQQGRCAITLEHTNAKPGQQSYQGLVGLLDENQQSYQRFSDVMAHYMRQSEQIDTTLVLAANGQLAAGLLLQRVAPTGAGNLAAASHNEQDEARHLEDCQRIAMLASSLQSEELLMLDAHNILHRLFWQEQLVLLEHLSGAQGPRFCCTCSPKRVARMIASLGEPEALSILQERASIDVACDFCGRQYHFDAIDVTLIFRQSQS